MAHNVTTHEVDAVVCLPSADLLLLPFLLQHLVLTEVIQIHVRCLFVGGQIVRLPVECDSEQVLLVSLSKVMLAAVYSL